MTRVRPATSPRALRTLPFAEDAIIRRVHRDGLVLLGGGRALLMQVAHPAVAAGVADHSDFRARPLRRLVRTLRPTLAIAHGTREEALAAAAEVNAVHARVVGPGYRALDPDLLFWVLATLIDSALLVHRRFLRAIPAAEEEAYYQDMLTAGAALGVRPERAPADMVAFRAYTEEMTRTLQVSDTGRALARDIFGPPLRGTPMGWALEQLAAGLLPEPLRRQFGLDWGPERAAAMEAFARLSRRLVPLLPPPVREHPWPLMPRSRWPRLARRLLPAGAY